MNIPQSIIDEDRRIIAQHLELLAMEQRRRNANNQTFSFSFGDFLSKK